MRLLASPRRRRRLGGSLAALAIAAPLVYLGVRVSTPGNSGRATGPYVHDSYYVKPRHVPFTADKRRQVRTVLDEFAHTAVARKHVAESWAVTGPSLRGGLTRRQWATGDIPVVPYPVAPRSRVDWSAVQYSYRNKVGLELLLLPDRSSGYSAASVDADVVRGRDGRWRVDYWMITKFHGPGAAAPSDSSSALQEGPPGVHRVPGKQPKRPRPTH
jgi:hypothetical protein